jgi:NADH:ubiquinone reductase (H+-translocating)
VAPRDAESDLPGGRSFGCGGTVISHLTLLFVSGVTLVALTLYVLLGGADYGAGVWDLLATGPRTLKQRQFLSHAIGPVWEADHVWLILVIVVLFTAFPPAFAAITTSLNVPITLMLVGIVLRGAAFSFRSYGSGEAKSWREWGRLFSIASTITPVLLGVTIGAIASGRIPENPSRLSDFVTPWLTPFGFAVGLMALALFSHLSAVYALCEIDDVNLSDDFRVRAIASGIVAGVMAGIVLLLSTNEAPVVWHALVHRNSEWPLVCLAAALASTALFCLWTRRFKIARFCAAGEVALILWAWAFAQFPYLVPPDLTIYNSAAPPLTMRILAAALIGGSFLLLPSYKYLLDIFKSERHYGQKSPWADSKRPHVVIVGGGFAGVAAAKALGGQPVRLTIIDKRNHFLFQPLLYQVATAALSPADIATPIRHIVRHQRNTRVILDEALSIDSARKVVALSECEIAYDYLIVASGANHSYFGHNDWGQDAPGLKTLEQAIEIRRRVLVAFEAAEREEDPAAQQTWLTFVIIGAGPTGVELAGALTEISRRLLPDFTRISTQKIRVVLMDMGPRVLLAMSQQSSMSAARELRRLGVELMLATGVTEVDKGGVTHEQGRIASRTVLWAAGVAASQLGRSLGTSVDRADRVVVNQDLSVPGAPDVFVVGDLAAVTSNGKPVPGVAPAAMQEGRHAARNIGRIIRGEAVAPFHYVDKGSLATVGRGCAVAEVGSLRLSGLVAWMAWLGIHIFYLVGLHRRIIVLTQWAWLYLRNARGARLIIGDVASLLQRGRDELGSPRKSKEPEKKGKRVIARVG